MPLVNTFLSTALSHFSILLLNIYESKAQQTYFLLLFLQANSI